MASIHLVPETGYYRIRFRWAGQNVSRSLRTRDEKEAADVCGRVAETLALIERGRVVIPEDADPIEFIVSDGKRTKSIKEETKPVTFGELATQYTESIPAGAKSPSTIYGEQIHIRHLLRLIGSRKPITKLDVAAVQRYVSMRSKESYRGKPIEAPTIEKELRTLRIIWNWARDREIVVKPAPVRNVVLPLSPQKPPFRTWKEIEKTIDRGGLTDQQQQEAWDCLFLSVPEIENLLEHVRKAAAFPFILPLFAFAAWTGARRSEIIRSEISDWNFKDGVVTIREKKRKRTRAMSYRTVPIHSSLRKVMEEWLKSGHPGGQWMICKQRVMPRGKRTEVPRQLTPNEATWHFLQPLIRSRWEVVKGYHTLRHSFASNLASKGVPQHIINAWMGHQSEEMVDRYRHLFPSDHARAMESLTGSGIDGLLGS